MSNFKYIKRVISIKIFFCQIKRYRYLQYWLNRINPDMQIFPDTINRLPPDLRVVDTALCKYHHLIRFMNTLFTWPDPLIFENHYNITIYVTFYTICYFLINSEMFYIFTCSNYIHCFEFLSFPFFNLLRLLYSFLTPIKIRHNTVR